MKIRNKTVVVVAIAALGFINMNFKNSNGSDSFNIANIDALATALAGPGDEYACWEMISSEGEGNATHITYCGDCGPHLAKTWTNANTCTPNPPPN